MKQPLLAHIYPAVGVVLLTVVPVARQSKVGVKVEAVDVPEEAYKTQCQIIWHVLYL